MKDWLNPLSVVGIILNQIDVYTVQKPNENIMGGLFNLFNLFNYAVINVVLLALKQAIYSQGYILVMTVG